jgi:hypothetical protein
VIGALFSLGAEAMKAEAHPKEQFDRFVAQQSQIKANFSVALAASGKTQAQVARDVGIDEGNFSKIVNGLGNPQL